MVKTIIRTEQDETMRASLELMLREFPIFKETDAIQVVSFGDKIAVAYLTDGNRRAGATYFDLELKPNICDILGFGIKQEHRNKGYGRALYLVIERFALREGYQRMQTSPSGDGITFWPHMGLTKTCKVGVEKVLQSD